MDTIRTGTNCPFYRGVRLIKSLDTVKLLKKSAQVSVNRELTVLSSDVAIVVARLSKAPYIHQSRPIGISLGTLKGTGPKTFFPVNCQVFLLL